MLHEQAPPCSERSYRSHRVCCELKGMAPSSSVPGAAHCGGARRRRYCSARNAARTLRGRRRACGSGRSYSHGYSVPSPGQYYAIPGLWPFLRVPRSNRLPTKLCGSPHGAIWGVSGEFRDQNARPRLPSSPPSAGVYRKVRQPPKQRMAEHLSPPCHGLRGLPRPRAALPGPYRRPTPVEATHKAREWPFRSRFARSN